MVAVIIAISTGRSLLVGCFMLHQTKGMANKWLFMFHNSHIKKIQGVTVFDEGNL